MRRDSGLTCGVQVIMQSCLDLISCREAAQVNKFFAYFLLKLVTKYLAGQTKTYFHGTPTLYLGYFIVYRKVIVGKVTIDTKIM